MRSFESRWVIKFSPDAAKAYKRLPHNDGEKITAALDELNRDPHSGDVKKIKGVDNMWRRRIGDHRIVCQLLTSYRILLIVAIKRRTTSTYAL